MTKMSNHKSILGYTDTETVKLDFDDTSFKTVKYWVERTTKWFRLGGYVILKSSEKCYHAIFSRKVSWAENMHIVAWVSLLSRNLKLLKWFQMQSIKESSTLRISAKRRKPPPRVVYRHGKQDQQIMNFLKMRNLVKKIIKKL